MANHLSRLAARVRRANDRVQEARTESKEPGALRWITVLRERLAHLALSRAKNAFGAARSARR